MTATRQKNEGGQDSQAGADEPQTPSFVKKYFPVFENLILFILSQKRYIIALKAFLRRELDYRTRLLIQGLVLLIIAAAFLVGTVGMFMLGSVFLVRDLTGSITIAAFVNFGLGLLWCVFFLWLVNRRFTALSSPDRRPSEGLDDPLSAEKGRSENEDELDDEAELEWEAKRYRYRAYEDED